MASAEQLSRTTLLFQADLAISDPTAVFLALKASSIILLADDEVMNTLAGQVAVSTAAMLMARSGQRVYIDAPDASLVGHQPPMNGTTFWGAIVSVGNKLIDGVEVSIGCPIDIADIVFVFGKAISAKKIRAKRIVSVDWTDWSADLHEGYRRNCSNTGNWPMGAMAAAVLVAAEAIKIPGRILAQKFGSPVHFHELFAASPIARLVLAPESTRQIGRIGKFDIISAGAVSNAFLYALLRIPQAEGIARVFDGDTSECHNRNRNMLLLPEFAGTLKVDLFQHFSSGIQISAIPRHFAVSDLFGLASRVAIGVDDIPTRWILASAQTSWMGVGATSHFDSMASVHYPNAACVACLHPHDEALAGPTPTIAFVSFLTGLMMAADFISDLGERHATINSRYRFLNALQTGSSWSSSVVPYSKCPANCIASRGRAA